MIQHASLLILWPVPGLCMCFQLTGWGADRKTITFLGAQYRRIEIKAYAHVCVCVFMCVYVCVCVCVCMNVTERMATVT